MIEVLAQAAEAETNSGGITGSIQAGLGCLGAAIGVGLVGMKAGRLLAGASMGGRGNGSVFNSHYSKNLQGAPFNDFQKSYAFVLENGLDVVNADIQNVEILEENFAAAAMAEQYVV